MKEIKLTQGQFAIVDDDDFDYLNQWKWYAVKHRNTFYATRMEKRKHIHMHRVIMHVCPKLITDHIDHNGLNNQKSNLRACTSSQNKMNVLPMSNTGYLGVYYQGNLIRAKIRVNGNSIHIGCYPSLEQAARAYDIKAKEYFGEFANLNFK